MVLRNAQQFEADRVVVLEDGEQPAVEAGLGKGLLDLVGAVGERGLACRWRPAIFSQAGAGCPG